MEALKHIDCQRSDLVTLQVPVRRDIIEQSVRPGGGGRGESSEGGGGKGTGSVAAWLGCLQLAIKKMPSAVEMFPSVKCTKNWVAKSDKLGKLR